PGSHTYHRRRLPGSIPLFSSFRLSTGRPPPLSTLFPYTTLFRSQFCRHERGPAMAHFVRDLRHGVHVLRHLAVGRNLGELLLVEGDVAIGAYGRVRGRPLLHLIRADIHGLNKSPLEPTRRAVGREAALV